MGGSAKGKQKKGKGNSKSVSDDVYRQPGTSNSDPHPRKIKSENMSEFKTPKDKNEHPKIDLNSDVSGWEKNTKRSLEILLYNKLEGIYAEAFHKLVTSGYESDKARKAILMNGHWRGEKSILTNIIENSVTFLESKAETVKDPLQGCALLCERVECLMRMLIKDMQKIYPNESDAMKQLLGIGVGVGATSSTHPQHVQTENCNKDGSSADDSSGDNSYIDPTSNFVAEEDFGATVTKDLLSPEELEVTPTNAWPSDCPLKTTDPDDLDDSFLLKLLEKEPEDQKDLLILSIIKQYRELKKQVKESKEWALAKAKQADQKVINHVSELRRLRLENFEKQKWKTNITRVREMDIALWNAMSQLEQSTTAVIQHQHQNSVIRKDIACYCLDFSETNKTLRDVEKRERKILKRVRTKEREKIVLEELVEEEKQKVLQLNQELFQLNKAQEEAEVRDFVA